MELKERVERETELSSDNSRESFAQLQHKCLRAAYARAWRWEIRYLIDQPRGSAAISDVA